MHYIEKLNPSDNTIPCIRSGCPGVEPWFLHKAQITANACVVEPLDHPGVTECRAESDDGFVCTLSAGHDGDHFAFQDDGGECDRWDQ